MRPFPRSAPSGIRAKQVSMTDGEAVIDVRGQTCPGYLLAINRAVDALPPGTPARLLITYPPCGDDVRAWCKARGIALLGLEARPDMTVVRIRT